MRSELVYRANEKVPNRFQLCQLTSTSARSMIRSSVGMHLTINQALEAISGHAAPIVAPPPKSGVMKASASGQGFDVTLQALDPAV